MTAKRVLITGAGSGFGKGAAMALAERGHDVIATTVDVAQAEALRAEAPGIAVHKLDITDPSDVALAADWDVDVLINNAGLGCLGPLAHVPLADVRAVFEVNVFGTLAISQVVVRRMLERGSGRVLIVSSVAGLIAGPTSGPYSMTKHALQAMGASWRAELAPHGIDVGLINPGPFETGFNDRMAVAAVERFATSDAHPGDAAQVNELHDLITTNQGDPQEVVRVMVDLVEADEIPRQTVVPSDLLSRFGLE